MGSDFKNKDYEVFEFPDSTTEIMKRILEQNGQVLEMNRMLLTILGMIKVIVPKESGKK